jgi:phospholipase C
MVLDALTSNPELWSKTALFLMYDENDGWFDHVPPPTAPAGTPGGYLTATPSSTLEPGASSDDLGISGPLGLGVRVPCPVISPFSRGGHIASETFDHTSQLKLVAERFGVEVPNLSGSDPGSGQRAVVEPAGQRRMTTKSSNNRLARVTR